MSDVIRPLFSKKTTDLFSSTAENLVPGDSLSSPEVGFKGIRTLELITKPSIKALFLI